MKFYARVGLILMLFVIFMYTGILVTALVPEKKELVDTLIWFFCVGSGIYLIFGGGDE